MWEHTNCKECDESPTGYCDAYDKAHREYEAYRRGIIAMDKQIERHNRSLLRQEFQELARQFPTGRERITVGVRFERLHYLLRQEVEKRSDRGERRWAYVEAPHNDNGVGWGSVNEYRLKIFRTRAHYVEELIAACKEVGFTSDDPYLVDLQKQRRELRRELRCELRKQKPAKARAAHA